MSTDEYLEFCYCTAILEFKISKDDFFDLTPYEFSILLEHHGEKLKAEYTLTRNTILNAGINLMRGKGDPFVELFKQEETQDLTPVEEIKKEREALFGKK